MRIIATTLMLLLICLLQPLYVHATPFANQQASVSLQILDYCSLNILNDLAMQPTVAEYFGGLSVPSAFTEIEVCSNCPTVLRCPKTLTLVNDYATQVLHPVVGLTPYSTTNGILSYQGDYITMALAPGCYPGDGKGRVELSVSLPKTFSLDDLAGVYTGQLTLTMESQL
ncbi:MAG TPA: hypothetical protein VHV83_01885 [Armatimonadota bacterium]|nr:hypothetical protein [Armatimonadota bacterium]